MRGLRLDISVTPDLSGLPTNVVSGLQHLTNTAAGLLVVLSGLGIALSVIGIVIGSWSSNPHLAERSKMGLVVSVASTALLYVGVALANMTANLFRG